MSLKSLIGESEPLILTDITGKKSAINLKPLGVLWLPKFLKLSKKFASIKKSNLSPDQLSDQLDDESLDIMNDMVMATLDKSLPDESKEDKEKFALLYYTDIMEHIMKINSAGMKGGATEKQDKLHNRLQQVRTASETQPAVSEQA